MRANMPEAAKVAKTVASSGITSHRGTKTHSFLYSSISLFPDHSIGHIVK